MIGVHSSDLLKSNCKRFFFDEIHPASPTTPGWNKKNKKKKDRSSQRFLSDTLQAKFSE